MRDLSEGPACGVCGTIGASEYGYSKYGWPADDVPMNAAVSALVTVAGSRSGGRGEELQQCPSCGRFFHWKLSYEFLVNGSEDVETLQRIDTAEAGDLRVRLGGGPRLL